MITVFGSLNVDYIFHVNHLPQPGQTLLASDLAILPGGKGGNQALAAAKAGAEVRMVGATGRDGLGQIALAGLQANGVNTAHVVQVDQATGTASINVDAAGENTIVVFSGANGAVSHTHLDGGGLDDTTILLLQFEVPVAAMEKAIDLAKTAGAKVIWNLAPMGAVTLTLLKNIDYLLVNEGELTELCSALGLSDAGEYGLNNIDRITAVAEQTDQSIVVTLGAQGCLAYHQKRLISVPALAITPIDTVGAGDAFAGAFAAALDQDEAFEMALKWGNVAGAVACMQPGAQSALPTRTQILDRLPDLAS